MKIQNAEQLQRQLEALSKKTFLFSSSLSKAIDKIYHNTNFRTPITPEQSVTILQACHTLQQKEARFTGLWSKVFGKPQTSSLSALEQKTITQTGSLTQDTAKEFFERTLRSLGATEQQIKQICSDVNERTKLEMYSEGANSLLRQRKKFLSLVAECKEKKIDLPKDLPDPFSFLENSTTADLPSKIGQLESHIQKEKATQQLQINTKTTIDEAENSCLPSSFGNTAIKHLLEVSKYQPREKIKIISQLHLLDQLLPSDPAKQKEITSKIYKDLRPSLFSSKSVSAKKLSSILDKNIQSLSKGSEAKELKPINGDAFYLASLKIGLSYFLRDTTYEFSNLNQALNEIKTPNNKVVFIEICEKLFNSFHDASEYDKKRILSYLIDNKDTILNTLINSVVSNISQKLSITSSNTHSPYHDTICSAKEKLLSFYNKAHESSLNLVNKTGLFIFKEKAEIKCPKAFLAAKNLLAMRSFASNSNKNDGYDSYKENLPLFFYESTLAIQKWPEDVETDSFLSILYNLNLKNLQPQEIINKTEISICRKKIEKELEAIPNKSLEDFDKITKIKENMAQIFENPQQTPTLDQQVQIAQSILNSLQSVKDLDEQQQKQTLDYLLTYTPNPQTL